MKRLFGIILLIVLSTFSYSQSVTEFGVTAEGAWFMPHPINNFREYSTKAGFGTGVGVYASRNLFWRVSADIGLAYRYKQMQQYYAFYKDPVPGDTGGGGSYGGGYMDNKVEGWGKYSLHYVVVPVHLQLRIGQSHFIRGGIESTWLTNYDTGIKKTEYNWTVGWGRQKHKLKWSVNYIRGFKNVGFYNGIYEMEFGNVKYPSVTAYRNNTLQLNLSYPIWQKN